MDAKKFGAFIAKCRKDKHMTQSDLAEVLRVTDKAVSRWERGIGFPDINTIEPLADALGVSIIEFMKSEKIDEPMIHKDSINDVLTDTLELTKIQRQRERKSIMILLTIILILTLIILYIDLSMVIVDGDFISAILFFIYVALPFIGLIGGIVMLVYSYYRKRSLLYKQTLFIALCLLILPVIIMILMFIMVMMGGYPVPI